jgi:uncharacterized hydrophobic protein (TIGR00271 family)
MLPAVLDGRVTLMMQVEVFGPSGVMAEVASALGALDGVTRVRRVEAERSGHSVVAAAARPRAIDPLLDELARLGIPSSDIAVTRVDVVEWTARRDTEVALVWADVLGQAWINARPIGRYLVLMLAAGVIAAYGVIDRNAILIVGAMAVSPDLLPITAIAVALIGRSGRLAAAAFATLAAGLAVTCISAALITLAQDNLGNFPAGFSLDSASDALGGLTSIGHETIAVALVAGVAGMLSLETRASSAVGVAVSVTTIPAAAYLGVAAGLGEPGAAWGALGVLGANVAMMVLGACLTLVVQRRLRRPAGSPRSSQASG